MTQALTEEGESDTEEGVFPLEGSYLLTPSGVDYCIQKRIPLRDLRTWTGLRGTGFRWKTFRPVFVQRLLTNALLDTIEMERLEFISKRRELILMTTYVVYGILFKRFRPELKLLLRKTEYVRTVLHTNADNAPSLNASAVANFAKNNRTLINAMRHSLYFEPAKLMEKPGNLSQADLTEKKAALHRLIDSVDDETWFLFALLQKDADRQTLLTTIHSLIVSYVERMAVADYTPFILIEFIQYAEKAHLLNLAERDQAVRNDPEKADSLLRNPEFRERLLERARDQEEYISLNFNFTGNPHDPTARTIVCISVRNRGLVGYKTRADILEKKQKGVFNTPISRFFQEANVRQLSDGMGMYYLSYLEEACRNADMQFESTILRDENKDETVAQITLRI
jgi:hypothetical protein